MTPRLSAAETDLFVGFLRCSAHYVEFGTGGSTVLACKTTRGTVTSVDSSASWQAKVRDECSKQQTGVVPTLVHIDLGPVGNWGYPVDQSTRADWPSYYRSIWPRAADLVLIDGRFRVACFLTAALTCVPGTVLMIHDFDRDHYQSVRRVAREIARVGTLSAFIRSAYSLSAAKALLKEYELDAR